MQPKTRDAILSTKLGERVERATATLPQTTAAAIFTVANGRVLVTQILGQVTTAIQAQADNTKLIANPTTGSDVDLCAVLDITGIEVGGKLTISGTAATAMLKANAGAIIAQTTPVIVDPGTIDLSCSASNTGSVRWTLFYMPLESGAVITAA